MGTRGHNDGGECLIRGAGYGKNKFYKDFKVCPFFEAISSQGRGQNTNKKSGEISLDDILSTVKSSEREKPILPTFRGYSFKSERQFFFI